jgi:CheY-like chemotaxis protein
VEPQPHEPSPSVAVVDDDPTCTLVLERVLARGGYAVTVYPSGEAILAALATTSHIAVCLDLSLPGIDGLETLRRIKTTRPSLPVIVFTASADDVGPEALAAGAFACVPKAGAWSELTEAVRRAIDD